MDKRFHSPCATATLTCLLFVACVMLPVADTQDRFSDWFAPVNLGPTVNSPSVEIDMAISKDGRSLYFSSNRHGGFGGFDIWVCQRPSVDAPWLPPQNLGPTINTSFDEQGPSLTIDGHRMYFFSNGPGGFGGGDLYVARRHNKRDDFAWGPAENLGSGVNTSFNEGLPVHFEDDTTGVITLYFNSNRPDGLGRTDIYASTLQPDETFGSAVLVQELNSPFRDANQAIRRDGLEMIIASDRPGSLGFFDLWVSMRASTSDPWSPPVNLGVVVNSAADEGRAWLSFDATALYMTSNRPGGFGNVDIYLSTRTKLEEE